MKKNAKLNQIFITLFIAGKEHFSQMFIIFINIHKQRYNKIRNKVVIPKRSNSVRQGQGFIILGKRTRLDDLIIIYLS